MGRISRDGGPSVADTAALRGGVSSTTSQEDKRLLCMDGVDRDLTELGIATTAGVATTVASAVAAQAATDSATYAPRAAGLAPSARVPQLKTRGVLTHLQSGHGYTFLGTQDASSNLNDTANVGFGTQSVLLVTDGAGTATAVLRGGQTLDLTGKTVRVTYKLESDANLVHLRLYAGDSSLANSYMWEWHGQGFSTNNLIQSVSIGGEEWASITLSVADATVSGTPTRNSIAKLYFRAQDTGGGKATVHVAGIETVAEQSIFANGVVSFAFDDAYQTTFDLARPVLDAQGWGATSYIIADSLGLNSAGALRATAAECRQMESVSGWEIAAHAYTMNNHNLTNGFRDLATADLHAELASLKQFMRDNGFRGADHLALPKGMFDTRVLGVAKEYFASARTTASKVQHETLPPAFNHRLRSRSGYVTSGGINVAATEAIIDACVANKTWVILTGHNMVTSSPAAADMLQSDFQTIVTYVAGKGCTVLPVGDVLAAAAV